MTTRCTICDKEPASAMPTMHFVQACPYCVTSGTLLDTLKQTIHEAYIHDSKTETATFNQHSVDS